MQNLASLDFLWSWQRRIVGDELRSAVRQCCHCYVWWGGGLFRLLHC